MLAGVSSGLNNFSSGSSSSNSSFESLGDSSVNSFHLISSSSNDGSYVRYGVRYDADENSDPET